ncbi:MAG: MGMT family protein, partial [Cyclobacteriaceae bacterium]|nr:MGMT family protein [Cyclobacteriaceae bacterium]
KMKEHWSNSIFRKNQNLTDGFVKSIFNRSDPTSKQKLHLFVKGTNFQIKVWEALLKIPMGNVTTYQGVADHILNPKAIQAVGSAVGSNHVAYLIPCHRVIRKDGILGEYRWSPTRKKSMIGWEMSRIE